MNTDANARIEVPSYGSFESKTAGSGHGRVRSTGTMVIASMHGSPG